MRIMVDYNKVIEKLKSSKQIIEIMWLCNYTIINLNI
jgi:hypothetical protein